MKDSFGCRATFSVGSAEYGICRLDALAKDGVNLNRLPFAIRILLENLLRREDGEVVTKDDIQAVANWSAAAEPSTEIAYAPARVLLQDFTGVPAIVDLAAMRDAMSTLKGDATKINPLLPVELVIDHSVQVDEFGSAAALLINAEKEFERNHERYAFLRWGQTAFDNFKVVPPDTGIVHQVNLEYLARVVMTHAHGGGHPMAYPDTLVGTDSHTTMINGLGVLGWGVGGIEAEAAMLGEPISMLVPQVVGFRMTGKLAEGATATDLVLRVTEMLRAKGVVGKFVEFFGPGLSELALADRATIANMAPEYGATCGIFPVDDKTLDYMRFTGRSDALVALTETYMKQQGLFHTADTPPAEYTDTLELDLSSVEPSLAGPKRPQDRVRLGDVKSSFGEALGDLVAAASSSKPKLNVIGGDTSSGGGAATATMEVHDIDTLSAHVTTSNNGDSFDLKHGSVVIAAITSCTNTSNPSVMVAAGLVAMKAAERGLAPKPWVKTSLAPGSMVVTDYLKKSGLMTYLDQLRFNLVGYGCTTCIGNSGPLPPAISQAVHAGHLVAVSVLSGNRNFEGRVSPDVRANYLASPPLVVAYAIAGRIDLDLTTEPLGEGKDGKPVFLKDIWPTQQEIQDTVRSSLDPEMFENSYANVYTGDERWNALPVPSGDTYAWDEASTYVKNPPYFADMAVAPPQFQDIQNARVLALLGDSITTDHISPAGSIKADSPAGKYLQDHGVAPKDFNSYGSRRGNHEVMMRGTFANIRLRNLLVPGVEGGETLFMPDNKQMSIYDAAMKYQAEGVPTIVIAGKEYGTGSSRDWAAKGPNLLGVKAVIAQSYERIHRSNLVGMGIIPLEFKAGDSPKSLMITGHETFDIVRLADDLESGFANGREVTVIARGDGGSQTEFQATVRLDTPKEIQYIQHGGILPFVIRRLLNA